MEPDTGGSVLPGPGRGSAPLRALQRERGQDGGKAPAPPRRCPRSRGRGWPQRCSAGPASERVRARAPAAAPGAAGAPPTVRRLLRGASGSAMLLARRPRAGTAGRPSGRGRAAGQLPRPDPPCCRCGLRGSAATAGTGKARPAASSPGSAAASAARPDLSRPAPAPGCPEEAADATGAAVPARGSGSAAACRRAAAPRPGRGCCR